MRFSTVVSPLLAFSSIALGANSDAPGYLTGYSSNNSTTLSFGKHYAVLNLDLISAIVGGLNSSSVGRAFINSTATWIDAVHQKNPRPLGIFTRIYFSNAYRPELNPTSPFGSVAAPFGNITAASPQTEIYSGFKTDDRDVVIQKTRYSATTASLLLEILRSQMIDTVVLSGLRTSGVILATVYDLLDKDFNVYVIGDNVIEDPGNDAPAIDAVIKRDILPKLPATVITLKQALAALAKSG